MNESITLTIRMFGTFRKHHNGNLLLNASPGITTSTVKDLIAETFRQSIPTFIENDLIDKSVLADNTRILAQDECITESCTLAILPPVCGG